MNYRNRIVLHKETELPDKIAVVDDEERIGRLVKSVLSAAGYTVEAFMRPADLIAVLSKERYDIVISDLKMPEMDGLELLRKIKEISPGTDVIIMTGFAEIESVVQVIKLGAYDYMPKPFEIEDLQQRVTKCLQKRSLAGEVGELKEVLALYEISKAMSSSVGLKKLLELTINNACSILNADTGSIMLVDEGNEELRMAAYFGLKPEEADNAKVKLGAGISGWAAKNQEPLLLVNGLKDDTRFNKLVPRKEIKCSMVCPLKAREKIIGVICLNSERTDDFFKERHLKLLTIFATNAAMAIKDSGAYEKLKELDKLKDDFLANVSHELRTPLTSISGSIELISGEMMGTIPEPQKKILDIAKNSAERMVKLVTELLDYTRIGSGQLVLERKEADLVSLVKETIEESKPIAEKKKLELIFEYSGNPIILDIDPGRIKQVIVNLLGNAIKFTVEGSVRADISEENRVVRVVVSDTGMGIDEVNKDKIFERFFKVENSLERDNAGFGIGLSIAKDIVLAHGGNICVDTGYNNGARIMFTLPKKA